MKKYNVAVVGALGLVGTTMVQILEEYDFPVNELKVLESAALAGAPVAFKGDVVLTEEGTPDSFDGVDIALFATHEAVSAALAPEAAKRGAIAIDNSREFRLDPETPLVTPEVNAHDLEWHKGIIANPNCTTTGAIVVLKPIYDLSRIKRIYHRDNDSFMKCSSARQTLCILNSSNSSVTVRFNDSKEEYSHLSSGSRSSFRS